MQISRLFEIVYLLLNRKNVTAKELAERFEVSTRTIYRDVETLSQAGIPIYTSKGSGGGIRLTESFVLNKSVLSEEERQGILASLHGMDALKMQEVRPALEKLSALFGVESADWIEIDFSSWNPGDRISGCFQLLKEAIFARRVVTFQYSAANGETMERAAEPARLIYRGGGWYLLGWCRLRQDFRYFKLFRMEGLTLTGEAFCPRPLPPAPEGKVEHYCRMVSLTAEIQPELAFRVREEFRREQVTERPDGSFQVRFELPDDCWLDGYLLSFGPGLRLLDPPEIRDRLIGHYRAAIKEYEG